MNLTRRDWLRAAAAAGAGVSPFGCSKEHPPAHTPPDDDNAFARFPGKVAMRVISDRPVCLETPWRYFGHDLTPNEAFYVRWHLQAVPTAIDLKSWRLRVDGAVERPLELSMADLEQMANDEVIAVNQCSGNSRGLFGPRVPGPSGKTERWEMPAGRASASPNCCGAAGVKKGAAQVSF